MDYDADHEDEHVEQYRPFYLPFAPSPVIIKQNNTYDRLPFVERPYLGALLFNNESSDARDHCANERTFLSWLRLSTYMAVVAAAIIVNFHLHHQPTKLEKHYSLPLGLVFWALSIACLGNGLSNYILTVTRYSRRTALVQAGWKTQVVFTVVATSIIAACVLFLSTEVSSTRRAVLQAYLAPLF